MFWALASGVRGLFKMKKGDVVVVASFLVLAVHACMLALGELVSPVLRTVNALLFVGCRYALLCAALVTLYVRVTGFGFLVDTDLFLVWPLKHLLPLAVAVTQDVRSSADDKPMSRYLPGDLPPSRQRSSLGHGSPESAARGSRVRGSSRDKYRRGDSPSGSSSRRGRREPSPRGAGDRGDGRGDRRGRDFSPPSRGSEGGAGWERAGRGKPQRGGSPRNKKARYPGGERGGDGEDYDYERFTGAALHEGHEAFGGAEGPVEGPARPRHLERDHQGPGGRGGGGRGGGRGGRGRGGRGDNDPMAEPGFPSPYERGGPGRGRGRRGDMPAPAGRGGRGGINEHERGPRGGLEALDKTSVAVFSGVWKGDSGGRGGRGRGGRGAGPGGGRGPRELPGRGGGREGGRGGRGGRGGGGRGFPEEELPFDDHHPEDPYWGEELLPQFAPPRREAAAGRRGGEWEGEGRGRPLPPAELLPEWEDLDPRFHDPEARGGRGRGGGGRGGGGRGGRGGGRGGRGHAHFGPPGEDLALPPGERGWGPDEGGGAEDDGEWGGNGRGAAPPPADGGSGFQEWSAFDESPPRAAPPRRAPLGAAAGGGRGHPAGGGPGPRGGGRGPGRMGPPPGEHPERGMPPHGEYYDGAERPLRMRRREVSGFLLLFKCSCGTTSRAWRCCFHSLVGRIA